MAGERLDPPANETVTAVGEAATRAHRQKLFELMSGYRVSQAIYVAARLDIATL